MNKIIPKIYIVILAVFVAIPSFALASSFEAKTSGATSITQTGARLSGSASFEEGLGVAYFEYGTSYDLGNQAGDTHLVGKYQSASQAVFSEVYGLKSGTTYYFRMCLDAPVYGTDCGETLSFKTKSIPAPVVTNTSTSNSGSTSGSSTNNSSSSSSGTKSNTVKDSTESNNSQSASAIGATNDGNFLPDTFLEWIVVIALIFIIVMFGRYLYVKRQEEKEEEKRKQMEAQLRFQNA